jgi:hypothetical protein
MHAFIRVSTASLILALALIPNSQTAYAGVRITLSFDYVETEVSPRQGEYSTHIVNTYRISTNKRFDFSSNLSSDSHGALGQAITVFDAGGQSAKAIYRIDHGAMVTTGSWPSYTVVTRIVTDGHSSCSATRNYLKKAGHQYFEVTRTANHERMQDTSIRAENVSCSIAEE